MDIIRTTTRFSLLVLLSVFIFLASIGFASDVNQITKEQLQKVRNEKNVTILDTRRGSDWDASDLKIQNAVRADPENFKAWSKKHPQKNTLVLYCA